MLGGVVIFGEAGLPFGEVLLVDADCYLEEFFLVEGDDGGVG
jgi:hypothetical protein